MILIIDYFRYLDVPPVFHPSLDVLLRRGVHELHQGLSLALDQRRLLLALPS